MRLDRSSPIGWALPLLFIVGAFLLTRLLFLDSDAPLYAGTEYATIDEFYYATKALFWNRQHLYDRYADIMNHFPFQWLSNVATWIGLELLGTNFYGFRISAVIAGLITLIATYHLVARRFGILYGLFCAAYLLVDYHFMLASRIVEPTIYRTAIMLICLLLAREYLKAVVASPTGEASIWRRLFYTSVVAALYLLEYPTNYFVMVCWFLMLVVCERLTPIAMLWRAVQFFAVVAIAVGLYLLLIQSQGFYLDAPLLFLQVHAPRLAVNDHFVSAIVNNGIKLFRTQFLVNVPVMQLVFVAAGIAFGTLALRRWLTDTQNRQSADLNTRFDLVLALMLAGTLGHILLDNSYAVRKPIILLPLLLIALCYAVNAARKRVRWAAFAPVFLGGILCYSAAAHIPLAYQKLFADPRYSLRDASMAMAKYDGYYFLDGYAWVYSLYNNILPIGNNYLVDTIPDLGPSVPEFVRMYRQGTPTDPTLAILSSDPAYVSAGASFEAFEFLECSYEPRYYPTFVMARRGVAPGSAIFSAKVERHGDLSRPLELSGSLSECLFHNSLPTEFEPSAPLLGSQATE
jgi:hypothetical protein